MKKIFIMICLIAASITVNANTVHTANMAPTANTVSIADLRNKRLLKIEQENEQLKCQMASNKVIIADMDLHWTTREKARASNKKLYKVYTDNLVELWRNYRISRPEEYKIAFKKLKKTDRK